MSEFFYVLNLWFGEPIGELAVSLNLLEEAPQSFASDDYCDCYNTSGVLCSDDVSVKIMNEQVRGLDPIFVRNVGGIIRSLMNAVAWMLLFVVIFGYKEMLDLYSECKNILKKGAKELRKFFLFQEE